MYLAPALGEVTFWLMAILVSTILLVRGLTLSENNGQVDDLAAWQRNYERTQRRNR